MNNLFKIKLVWAQGQNYFDMGLLRRAFAGDFAEMPFDFEESIFSHDGDYEIPDSGGAVIVLASRQLNTPEKLKKLKDRISKLDWCLLICPGDEEGVFPAHYFKSHNTKVWVQHPDHTKPFLCDRKFIIGWAEDTPRLLSGCADLPISKRKYFWSFSGQNNHKRRQDCVDVLRNRPNDEGYLNVTGGFTQGLSRPDYFKLLSNTKIVPCPSGPFTPDCFRVWEACEAGCIPIVDRYSPARPNGDGYWDFMFGNIFGIPFPQVSNWSELNNILDYYKRHPLLLEEDSKTIADWWVDYKRVFTQNLIGDINELRSI